MEYTRTDIENELLVIIKSEELSTNHQPLIEKIIKWHDRKVKNLFDIVGSAYKCPNICDGAVINGTCNSCGCNW